jgi:hypothetical protein
MMMAAARLMVVLGRDDTAWWYCQQRSGDTYGTKTIFARRFFIAHLCQLQ